ncbi:MAG: hypothetical protein Q8869_01240 [Candidatus Phytoplasma australasiaticum]|nr:hypothetical protein [Candidatus Phytoplasma australasiaticum]
MRKAINDYLIKNQIITQSKFIQIGCYNMTPTTGLVVPLPEGKFEGMDIVAIYFDDGIRLLPKDEKTYTLADLLKLANGAKNIYLFSFNIHKKAKYIELPSADDPYQAIRDWKRNNNLYTFPPLVKESGYEEISKVFEDELDLTTNYGKKINTSVRAKLVLHYFETEDFDYVIKCDNSAFQKERLTKYVKDYMKWMMHAPIDIGTRCNGEHIRRIFGRSNKTLYDENGKTYDYEYEESSFFWAKDKFYIRGSGLGAISHDTELPRFTYYLSTTPRLQGLKN